jgi:hypothetical protein
MILIAKRDMGFLRHDSLNWNVRFKKSRSLLRVSLTQRYVPP